MDINVLSVEAEENEAGERTLIVMVEMPLNAIHGDDTPRKHRIVIPYRAIANRRDVYQLESDEEAVNAVMKEHAKRLNKLPDGDEHEELAINRMGGLRADVKVKIPAKALG